MPILPESLRNCSTAQLAAFVAKLPRATAERARNLLAWADCSRPEASFEAGPLLWGTTFTCTENPKWQEQGREFRQPFPRMGYFVPVMQQLLTARRLFICKTREMLTSWEVMLYVAWCMGWRPGTQAIVQADKEDKAWGLANYARILLRNSRPWLQERWGGLCVDSNGHIKLGNGSELLAVPSGEDQIRFYHPSLYVMDEAAKLPEAESCYNTADPVAGQIVAVSTAAPSWFGIECES